MQGAYLVVFGDSLSEASRPRHLRELRSGPGFTLYGTENLAAYELASNACLVGELFDRSGTPADMAKLCENRCPAGLKDHLLRNFWGTYLLFQADATELIATLSPAAAGNVPCIYRCDGRSGFLTSDISLAIDAGLYERRVDWDALAHRLLYPGIKSANTALSEVKELLPGTSLHIGISDVSVRQVWSPWTFVAPDARHATPHEAACAVGGAIESVVQAMAIADQSVLLELSGGLDSSIVAACLAHGPCEVVCVNLITSMPGVDERHYAALMAEALGVPLHVEPLSFEHSRLDFRIPMASVAPGMGPLQHAIDEIMSEAADRHGTNSFFSGGGGDSVFSYLRTAAPAVDAFKAAGFKKTLAAVRDLARMHQCTFWKAGRLTLSKLRRAPGPPHKPNTIFLADRLAEMPPDAHPWFSAPDDALPGDRERIFDLAGNQLFQGQAARALSRPFRFPLLSQPVMEACLRTPTWMWIDNGHNRAIARAAFRNKLPADVLYRQSKATYISYLGAVYQKSKSQIGEFLLGGRLAEQSLIDKSSVEAFLADALPARDQTFLRLFELCMAENWVRHQP